MGDGVLVVDDNEELARNLVDILALHEISATAVGDGMAAVQYIESDAPGVILLDMMMDGLDGSETLTEIRARRPDQPVLIITAYSEQNPIVQQAMAQGVEAVIQKPLDYGQLVEKIRHITTI